MKNFLSCLTALSVVIAFATPSIGQIVLVDEDFSTGPGLVVGGNSSVDGGFTVTGGVGTLTGNGTDTFYSVGVEGITDASLAMGGQLTVMVDNLGAVANPVTRWIQVDVDGNNVFMGRSFGDSNEPGILNHADDGMTNVGTTTIPAGTTELDVLFVTTVNFNDVPLPAGEIARLGSFFVEFTPDGGGGGGPLKGDVNLDSEVTFLDINPFIQVLSSGGTQAEADCNCDGEVNFLDIQAFIDILSGAS